ncbi:uncharacterized protein BDZ99DRAFT_32835 [Mytilinidion resinicola]|uniref:Uncharacterized protein n=1 Tax=Mytilinidion resinicola TaxID=574789 RepID=A0A6A6YM57_9PEZI|nr:uncharacterized protein BDZ99DRAFT_32835 [Mytilinidion resinicola]KAF2809618.1 hypothetical protein BDZ99DRAFT_32835 [Mytilinidion resinicola]
MTSSLNQPTSPPGKPSRKPKPASPYTVALHPKSLPGYNAPTVRTNHRPPPQETS